MSTLSSVTDGQLCDDAGVPGCAPNVVVQQSGTQAVAPSNPTTVSVQSFAATVVSLQQSAQVVVGGTQAPQVVVNDQSQRIVTTGQQGPRGVQGVPGPAGGVSELRTASEGLGGHRIVRSTGAGTVGYASNANPLHGDDTIGMSANAAVAGQDVAVITAGALTFNGWAWTPGKPVYLAADGLLTQTADMDTAAFVQVIGHASDAQTVFVAIEPPVYL